MERPLVSVIMPAYNCAKYIEKAIDSALQQDVPLEVIVINDCSKDDLDRVMLRYEEEERVIYLHNHENLGASGTRNYGVTQAKGRFVAFLDSDDYWMPGKLKKQMAAMKRNRVILCATARELMTPEGICTGRIIPVKEQITYRDLMKQNCINCSSVLMRTEVAKEFPM
ncbi:MAG: glycosyltransferase family 2 protein, partial [Anaerotignum sp.]|nr:glycosyltransferase family 2 protein [Anaerotignum sp.]